MNDVPITDCKQKIGAEGPPELDELDEMDDTMLVQRAKQGEREAYGELVRRHRAKVYGYARSITQEPFLAEDVVQDALIRAFLHIGTLVDAGRFLPWLHRIVRNQAYTKLKSKPIAQERPFTVLMWGMEEEPDEGQWHSLDYILLRLARSEAEHSKQEAAPEERLMRKELLETISGMLRCLNPKERQIFESHFFDHLSPQEIARLFHLSTANVYQILSRSRKKVVQEKIRVSVDHYVMNRKDMGCMKTKLLPDSGMLAETFTWTSAASALYGLLSYTDKKESLSRIMGLSGYAFRINICPGDVNIAGPTIYDFRKILSHGLRNLGFQARIVDVASLKLGPNTNLVDASMLTPEAKTKRKLHEALPEALNLIHDSIDRGLPVLSWDLFVPEFGLIYGYDHGSRKFMAVECGNEEHIPYDHLGRGILEDLFVLALDEPYAIDARGQLKGALQLILHHYHGREERIHNNVHGLAAYDAWVEAFRGGKVEPNGNSYNTAVVQDARQYAAQFLNELSGTWQGDAAADKRIRNISKEAAGLYEHMAAQLQELRQLFPFPAGGEPNDPEQAERAIAILQSVKALEEQAIVLLELMDSELSR
ncbi:RNA polymerase sigma factor [Paenibacillus apiarius]|uniref:RNA polymerase sigma factor n=2 Tax=Paenibacillus apiarius TaxID=46240 RepID=A0ABT4DVZ4_9BACL|nr:RNA polymerase sigma factor [Paenibacillus apiarius]MCY9514276.1 RNA polymerase sigma factor [Paenibacillus apiarius]MCY9520141.1 RNA polymerase sigma factor [Paenibacillus apiarius]MCY9550148.1 RNA polymerase sigma factor [Paenibacillus apiarius]MCY9560241.1 RNA polymerase sigma factor [Paenibacillus apiarius]MCY9683139.1 RNA polymerase sigma factor [Paenibacillus apiarius]